MLDNRNSIIYDVICPVYFTDLGPGSGGFRQGWLWRPGKRFAGCAVGPDLAVCWALGRPTRGIGTTFASNGWTYSTDCLWELSGGRAAPSRTTLSGRRRRVSEVTAINMSETTPRSDPAQTAASPIEVHWHDHGVARQERERVNGHRGCVLWLTGLSASGKSTVANVVDHELHGMGIRSFVLDGDNIRHGLNAGPSLLKERHGEEFARRFGLGFSAQDREENIRRIGAVARLFCDAGVIAITAFISPYRADRDGARAMVAEGDFIEVFVDAPLEVCEARDPKGLYRKARAGELKGFTGIDDPYEPPKKPDLVLDAAAKSPETLAEQVIAYLRVSGKIG